MVTPLHPTARHGSSPDAALAICFVSGEFDGADMAIDEEVLACADKLLPWRQEALRRLCV
jgi:hypothetical protein